MRDLSFARGSLATPGSTFKIDSRVPQDSANSNCNAADINSPLAQTSTKNQVNLNPQNGERLFAIPNPGIEPVISF